LLKIALANTRLMNMEWNPHFERASHIKQGKYESLCDGAGIELWL